MSKCYHPNIIKLVEIYEDKIYLDLIKEECRGGTLFAGLLIFLNFVPIWKTNKRKTIRILKKNGRWRRNIYRKWCCKNI